MKRFCIISFMLLMGNLLSAQPFAVVEFSVSNLRQKPDYESPLETQELMGTVVEYLDTEGYWMKIKSPQPYEAWATDKGYIKMNRESIEAYEKAPKYICVANVSTVYSDASRDSDPISDLVMGDVLRKVYMSGKIYRSKGFVKVILPSGKRGWVPEEDLMDKDMWKRQCADNLVAGKTADNIVKLAKRFVGIPYLWGGMSPKGFDCSGLVRLCYLMNGIELPRNASQQVKLGKNVELSDLKPGDLLFFGSVDDGGNEKVTHVGMYIGKNHFIHSSHVVRINSLIKGDSDCYENVSRLLRARRML